MKDTNLFKYTYILGETLILGYLVTFSCWVVHVFTKKVNSLLLEKISFDRKSSLVHTYVEIREHCSCTELYTTLTDRSHTEQIFNVFLFQCFSFTFTFLFFRTIVYSENCCKIEHESVNLVILFQFYVNWRIIVP